MLVGYMRLSKTDGSQLTDLEREALLEAAVAPEQLYEDHASGTQEARPCLRALRADDALVIWKIDRLGRNLRHLIEAVQNLTDRGVGLRVLAGQGAAIDFTSANARLMFDFFAALAEFEGELIVERTVAGLAPARAAVRGRRFEMTAAKLRRAQVAMSESETRVGELCAELEVTRQTLHPHVTPTRELRLDGQRCSGG